MYNIDQFDSESEALQADVMRFMAIIAFSLLIIFIPLIESLNENAPQQTTVVPEPPKPELITPEPPKPELITPEPPKLELITPEKPKLELVAPEQPKPELVTPEQPKPELITPEPPKLELITPEKPKLELVAPEQLKPELVTPEQPKPELIAPEPLKPALITPEPPVKKGKLLRFKEGAFERLLSEKKISCYVVVVDHNLCFEIMAVNGNYKFSKATVSKPENLRGLRKATLPSVLIKDFRKELSSLAGYKHEYYFDSSPSAKISNEISEIIRGNKYGIFTIRADGGIDYEN